jgi:guanylate kinase
MSEKPIVLIVGESGSGKSTICQYLSDNYGLKELKSYTTRPKRGEFDTSHTFITQEEFNCICMDAVAYTKFDDFEYLATKGQVDDSDLYIVDMNGVKTFMNIYDGERVPYVVYIKADGLDRLENMIRRGDSLSNAVRRIEHDKTAFEDVYDYATFVYENHIDNLESVRKIGDSIYKEFFKGKE